MTLKKCTSCGREFVASSQYFHRDRAQADGLRFRCKACSRVNARDSMRRVRERRKKR